MIRLLTSSPETFNVDQLLSEAQMVLPEARAVNQVGDDLALYLPDGSVASESSWSAIVASHEPIPPQSQESLVMIPATAVAEALASIETIEDVVPALINLRTIVTQALAEEAT